MSKGLHPVLPDLTPSVVSFQSQASDEGKESFRLASEDIHLDKTLERCHGRTFGCSCPNDRTHWQLAAKKRGRLRHDQVRLQILSHRILSEVRKGDADACDRVFCRQWHRIT